MRGSDGDGAVAAAAALAAATRMPAGAARVAEDEAPLSALCAVAAGGTSKERFEISFGDEENAGTETAAAAHATDALANLAAHASSAKILAASPTALSAWLEAVTRLCASRRPETRAAGGALRARLRRGGGLFFKTRARVAALVAAIAERLSDPARFSRRVSALPDARPRSRSRVSSRRRPENRRSSTRSSPRSVRRRGVGALGVGAGGSVRDSRAAPAAGASRRDRDENLVRVSPEHKRGYHADERRRGPGARR